MLCSGSMSTGIRNSECHDLETIFDAKASFRSNNVVLRPVAVNFTMPIAIKCPCGRRIVFNDRVAGKRIRCPDCNDICEVPLVSAEQRIPNDANLGATKEKSIAAPAAKIPSQQFEDPHSFQVSGQDINCGPVLVLPAICVATSDRTDISEVKTSFMYRTPFVNAIGPICLVAIFLGKSLPFPIRILAFMGLVYLPVYHVFRGRTHRCRVTYYLSQKILVLKRCLKVGAGALLFGSSAVFWHGLTMNRVDMTPLFAGLLLLFAAALAYNV
jgi:hypothetical protein